jgi:hypothetical protein
VIELKILIEIQKIGDILTSSPIFT